jgi:seryl-tRNA synthetase
VAQIMAKHAAVVGPLVGRLVESVHQFDIAARESDRARRSLEAQHDELVAQHDELVAQHDGLMQRHDQLVEGYAALDQRVEDLAVLADRREADVGRLTVELEAVRSRRVVRGVDRLASLLRGLRR